MRYRIGLCDDEISTCSVLEKYIIDCFKEKGDNVEVFVWNSAESFIEDVPQKTCLDILFLDIELPGKNGIDVGYYIRESIVKSKFVCKFIFQLCGFIYATFIFKRFD